ncbi:GON-4-like protein isoform X2 [Dunckerocampus dactyliophorus]|uniref:GON-4-like protein isoform X2 n=1 Tax=Dunckerocampus dactyliophorus TaxID=161453 RepID=UPI0024068855|nr:GON-4-like protein isoform X2 [Dunckerocampus dactyliophorus]
MHNQETFFSEERKLASVSLVDAGHEDEMRPLSGGCRMEDATLMETLESSEDELGRLDIDLDRKSRQHNLTSCNVRTILHEVITHEHVVAMMKAAIRDTQDMPMFEPKMTRSRLKRAVQQGQCLSWSLSAEKVLQPHFVNIDLEGDEDSSDEEYCPDEEDEEDTAEESFLSDGDSISPPKVQQSRLLPEGLQCSPGHLMSTSPYNLTDVAGPSFLERLNAVEEELDCGSAYTSFSSHRTEEEEDNKGSSCLAFRTRSKLRLVNVPLEQLEAELLAPDITADMYEQSPPQQEEDRHWTRWLQGLMAPVNEEDADDDDDPEYNFLDDLDEPDLEDYRTDRAVQITKREVNELLEELFETLQEQEPAEEEEEEEEEQPAEGEEPETGPKFNVPQALCFEPPLAGMLTERRRAVREQYQALQHRRALQDTTNHPTDRMNDAATTLSTWVLQSQAYPTFHLDSAQKQQLQQQIQQHVQLLTEIHLLSRGVHVLQHEASVTKHFLEELQRFAVRQEQLFHASSFRACNLQGALDLLQEVEQRVDTPPAPPPTSRRWLPTMTPSTISHAFPVLPSDTAWLFATRPVFLYPQLLPVCSLDPAHHARPHRSSFTAGEDGLIVLALKHFEGTVQSDHLISSYLLCKSGWNMRKHIREMSSSRAPRVNVIKSFLTEQVVPPLQLACERVQFGDQRPPVDRDTSIMPSWLKNSQEIIQKTQLNTFAPRYPPFLPRGCTLRLHPSRTKKYSRQPAPSQRRLFTLAHNESLQPICPAERKEVEHVTGLPLRSSLSSASLIPCSAAPLKASYIILQRDGTSKVTAISQKALENHVYGVVHVEQEETESRLHLVTKTQAKETEQDIASVFVSALNPTQDDVHHRTAKWGQDGEEGGQGEDEEGGGEEGGQGEDGEGKEEEQGEDDDVGGGQEGDGGGKGEGQGEDEEEGEEEGGQGEDQGGRDREKDDDQERQEEEEEDEDFDDLTQDEDEEEVMSSASEESVLSIPELQETMKQLTWLASKRRLVADVESEEDHSPTSPGSQEEEEEEEEGPKGEGLEEGSSSKVSEDDDTLTCEETPRGGGRGGGGGGGGRRGRGQSRPLRGLRRGRQERHSKDATKLSQLYDENILDNDPQRDNKDVAFAQSYLSRVREALRDVPGKMEEFVSLLNNLEQLEGQKVIHVFRKLRCILGSQTELMRDFAAFLHPEQALECGLFQEQQAFERSRRFLRQLEITFGDNPSHYNKIIKALQPGPDLSPTSINELKAQMASLLKGHTHLQAEFWVFFDELRPPPARPGQFEEAHWPEENGAGSDGIEGFSCLNRGVADGSFEEVTLPDVEEDGQKIQPMTGRRQRRKIDSHRSYKCLCSGQESDWSHKEWSCLCHDSKSQRHRRRGCSHCLGNKGSGGVSRAIKSLDPLYPQIGSAFEETIDKDVDLKVDDNSPQPGVCMDPSMASWEGSFPLAERDDYDEDEVDHSEKMESPPLKRKRDEEPHPPRDSMTTSVAPPPPDVPVCAQNISLTPSGEKVILWTREADRVILTACQQEGANQNTFQSISSLLGNKTPSEVSRRFRDLMCLFQTAARQASSEDEAAPTELEANEEQD